MNSEKTLTDGRIYPTLISFAVPIFFSMLLQALYGAVDLMVVGNFATTADVSAVSISCNLMNSITQVVAGLSMGVTVIVGEKIGEKNRFISVWRHLLLHGYRS